MSRRTDRVGELLRQEIARIVREEVKDPRVGFATVMGADASPDLRQARVFVSVMGSEEEKRETLEALRRASGFIRARIGEHLTLKYLPELRFELDRTLERAARIDALIEEAVGHPPDREDAGATEEPRPEEGGER